MIVNHSKMGFSSSISFLKWIFVCSFRTSKEKKKECGSFSLFAFWQRIKRKLNEISEIQSHLKSHLYGGEYKDERRNLNHTDEKYQVTHEFGGVVIDVCQGGEETKIYENH